jgi:ketosteroid isomerase-like protein
MTDHPHVAIVKRACIAARKGDRSVATELFGEKSDLFIPGRNLLAGLYEGREAMYEFYEKARELSGGTFKSSIHDVVANQRHAFAIEHFMASRGGRHLDCRDVTIFHVVDGRITSGTRLLGEDPYLLDEFWS